ncbi:MAG TPA: HNH endonuclease [Bacillus bacterium]|nr:HNH endonuclease [Bacillus sp. (in: firmicutes)]
MKQYKTYEQKRTFYKSSGWEKLRQEALKRDNYECKECKRLGHVHVDSKKIDGERKSIELNVDHIKEIETHPELALELDNLQTLCIRHHNEKHGRFSKKENKWTHDERW